MNEIAYIDVYFGDSEGGFPFRLTHEEIEANQGISLDTGQQFLVQKMKGKAHQFKITNLFNSSDLMNNKSYGSIIAIKVIYEDEQETWVKAAVENSGQANNPGYAIGKNMNGVSYTNAINAGGYLSSTPYIGLTGDWIVYEMEAPMIKDDDCEVVLNANGSELKIHDEVVVRATHTNNTIVQGTWTFDEEWLEVVSEKESELKIRGLKSGTYTIEYSGVHEDGGICESAITIEFKSEDDVDEPTNCIVDLYSNRSVIYPQSEAVITVERHGEGRVVEHKWLIDDIGMRIMHDGTDQLRVEGVLAGSYKIRYLIAYDSGQSCESSLTITVKPKPDDEDEEEEVVPPEMPENPDEEEWYEGSNYELSASKANIDHYMLPQFKKRNARYRGPRESDKYLLGQSEKSYDVFTIAKELEERKNNGERVANEWFYEETGDNRNNTLVIEDMVIWLNMGQPGYAINSRRAIRDYENVVVKLDGDIVSSHLYSLNGHELLLDSSLLSASHVKVSYKATYIETQATMIGTRSLTHRARELEKHLILLKGVMKDYENAPE